jgi:serine/threonine protein kinase
MKRLRRVVVLKNVLANYDLHTLLGKGSTARVHLAKRRKDQGKFAIKTVEKSKLMEKERNMLCFAKEVDILRRLNHPNIIRFYELYENEVYVHLVLEYLKSGDLLSHLQNKGVYSEKDASHVIRRILEALEYCHARNIIHRDLKPENLIIM